MAALAAAVLAAPAAAAPAAVPGGLLTSAPLVLSPGPPNGDLSAGLEGWTVQGGLAPSPLPAGRGVSVPGNTTLVSPPLVVPAGAQVLRVTLRAPGGDGLVALAARPAEGGADVALGIAEPTRARRAYEVRLPATLAGRAVRIVVDPVPALGTSLEVLRVGPLVAPLPGWSVEAGVPRVAGAAGRRTLRVADAPLRMTAPSYRPPRAARHLTLEVRGDGVVRARAGAGGTAARAGARWRVVRVALPRRAAAVRLTIAATPGPGGLEVRRLGVVALRTPGSSGGS